MKGHGKRATCWYFERLMNKVKTDK